MPESIEELQSRLEVAVASGFRDRLLDKGLARGLIWRDGMLPVGSPSFPDSLTEDLLDYAHTVMAMALRLRSLASDALPLERAFLVAGEAIEAAVHRGSGGLDQGFHRVTAAVAFHLAKYAARAYSMLPVGLEGDNLAPTETALIRLLRRSLDDMHGAISSWLLSGEHEDEIVAARLQDDPEFDEIDAAHNVITTSFMRGLALFDHAIATGEDESAALAKQRLIATANVARDLNAVSHWWTATLASHLIDELWQLSLYKQIPILSPDDDDCESWSYLRRGYIQRLRARRRSAIELWPSQIDAVARAVSPLDDLVVALPTSAGKTRIAEICILRALAGNQRIIYVTPLRALSAQVERDLAETFVPLGFSVSALYGSAGVESGDAEILREGKIVVSTPEKLDFALRNDHSIIDDVGLVVLDEGHMLGPNEREVRYEALVQRLLRRDDAASRRIVCLSALFPKPEEMSDLVAWIRQDEPGNPVHSTWRPTRQRFGVLQWQFSAARLDVKVEGESPFVPSFIEERKPPKGSRRKKRFPSNKNELTLATAWRFVEQEKQVLIYCALRKSVETLGRLVLQCGKHGLLAPLRAMNPQIQDAMATGAEWLGPDHPAVQCLKYGVALHHGGLPRPFLNEIERLLRSGDCPVTIASPTLAQGLNLAASVLLVPSIWRKKEIIPPAEFANVAGRAGRAFVDVEGLVLHVVWEATTRDRRRAIRNWEKLVTAARAPRVASGLLLLAENIYNRIAETADISSEEVVDYITGHAEAWNFNGPSKANVDVTDKEWERDIASLDASILALLDAETADADLEAALDGVLERSLFSRQLAQREHKVQKLLREFVVARTQHIWSQTHAMQRKGYHAAGIGLQAGQFLDENLGTLVDLLARAEAGVIEGDALRTAQVVVEFAELVFQRAPFRAPGEMPGRWRDILQAWMEELPAAEVVTIGDENGVDFLQEVLTYRLPWAMEAVRVHAAAVGQEGSDELHGIAALAVEAGSSNRSVITLLRSGLASREAAIAAVASTGASFEDHAGMLEWLGSDEVQLKRTEVQWPTAKSRHAWLQFYREAMQGDRRKWRRELKLVDVKWFGSAPTKGSHVVVEVSEINAACLVLSPDFVKLGITKSPLSRPHRDFVGARVGNDSRTVAVEFFGPPLTS